MAADLTGIINQGEFFSQHYLDEILEKDLKEALKPGLDGASAVGSPRAVADGLRGLTKDYFKVLAQVGDVAVSGAAVSAAESDTESLSTSAVQKLFELSRPFQIQLLETLGYTYQSGATFVAGDHAVPILVEVEQGGSPYLVALSGRFTAEAESPLDAPFGRTLPGAAPEGLKPMPHGTTVGDVIQAIFAEETPPRWVLLLSGSDVILGERARWGKGQYLRFDLGELLARKDATALGITAVLLAQGSLCPEGGAPIHDTLDEKSHKHAHGVSADLKHAAREAVELIGNGYADWEREKGHKKKYGDDAARALTEECLIYLYRLLFLFYAEARAEEFHSLPMNSEEYALGYSLEMLRELEQVPLTTPESQDGTFFDASLKRIFSLVNGGYAPEQTELAPTTSRTERDYIERGFTLEGLQSPLFDPASTPRLSRATLKNSTLQQVVRLLSLSPEGRKGRGKSAYGRGRISYAQLGINQLGSVYEGLLSYTGFFSKEDLYEVHKAGEKGTDKTQQAYFVPAKDLARYSEEELLFEDTDASGQTRATKREYKKGTFIFRLAGRDRESSASYYTPEVLTRCLVKYSLKELLKDKTADDILKLTVCEPAMGSGAFLVEAVSQLSDAYLERKQEELKDADLPAEQKRIPPDKYPLEKQKVNTFIASHNCYGVDLNPMAARLAGVSLWLATMHEGQKTPWFGGRLAVGNSLVGARLEVWAASDLDTDEPLAKALTPLIKKYGGAADFEQKVAEALTLHEKTAPEAVEAVRKLFEEERRVLNAVESETAADNDEGQGDSSKGLEGGAPTAGSARFDGIREGTLKALKKLQKAFKLPRHHRKPPTVVSASDVIAGKRPAGSVYHFLLWDEGMSPFDSDKAIKELAPKEVELLKKWRKGLTTKYTKSEVEHLGKLSDRVDELFARWAAERSRVMVACRSEAPVWGQPAQTKPAGGYLPLAQRERALHRVKHPSGTPFVGDVPSAYERLRETMDAWVALWGWPLQQAALLPDRKAWWKLLGDILGSEGELPEEVTEEQLGLLLDEAPSSASGESVVPAADDAGFDSPRQVARVAAAALTPHHWELEFAEVFATQQKGATSAASSPRSGEARPAGDEAEEARWTESPHDPRSGAGGFDLTVGNPPWIKLQWNEQGLLEDIDPRLALDGTSASDAAKKRAAVLGDTHVGEYLNAFVGLEGVKTSLNSGANYPLLVGVQTNLYKAFIERGWGLGSATGFLGMIHQDGVFDDPKGGALRSGFYRRMRGAYRFKNELVLFADVHHLRPYCLSITAARAGDAVQAATLGNLFHPSTIDASFAHDGHGAVPGIKTDDNEFETRGHKSRLVHITETELALFARLYSEPGTPPAEAVLPILHSTEDLNLIGAAVGYEHPLDKYGRAVGSNKFWHERDRQSDGTLVKDLGSNVPMESVVLAGPNIYVGTPFYKEPRPGCRHNQDYDILDLECLPASFVPRTNLRPASGIDAYRGRIPRFGSVPIVDLYRHAHRRMVPPTGERSFAPAILPPGPAHVDGVYAMYSADEGLLLRYDAFACSLPVDALLRISGSTNLWRAMAIRFPIYRDGHAAQSAIGRVLRLNCLTTHYADLWSRNWQPGVGWSSDDTRLSPWPAEGAEWSRASAVRNHFERRWALVELDALAALELKLTIDELCTIYRTQFPVLRDYEGDTHYDANGRIAFTNNRGLTGVGIAKRADFEAWRAHLLALREGGSPEPLSDALQAEITEKKLTPFTDPSLPPFDVRDREADMRHAYDFFARGLGLEVPA